MLQKKGNRILAGIVIAGVLICCNCSGLSSPSTVTVDQNTSTGTAAIKMTAARNSPFSLIAAKAEFIVSAHDMLIRTGTLNVTDTSVEGLITGITAGKNRLFEVLVYDSVENLQYKGSATADIFPDSTVIVYLSIYRVTGNAIINGTIYDTGNATSSEPFLIAHWSFDSSSGSTYYDVTGNGFDASSEGLSLTPGVRGQALNCPGSGYELIVQNSKDHFNVPQFTLETWVSTNIGANNGDIFQKIFDYQLINTGIYNGYGVHITPEGQVLFSSANGDYAWIKVLSTTVLKPKVWYHIACTFDGSYMKLYINGVLENSVPFSGTYDIPDADARIGCQTRTEGNTLYHLDGKLDEMKLYRNALTAEMIHTHYYNDKYY